MVKLTITEHEGGYQVHRVENGEGTSAILAELPAEVQAMFDGDLGGEAVEEEESPDESQEDAIPTEGKAKIEEMFKK